MTKLKQQLKLVNIEKYKEVIVNISISKIIQKFYQNRIENIKDAPPNGYKNDMTPDAFGANLRLHSIKPIAEEIGNCFRKVSFKIFHCEVQIKIEFRGIKKVEDTYLEIRNQIKAILKDYQYTDSHFKTETLFVNLSLKKSEKWINTKIWIYRRNMSP